MTAERRDEAPRRSLPQLDGLIERGADEIVAIGRKCSLNDQPLVTGHPLHRLGLTHRVPQNHSIVVRAGHKHLTLGAARFRVPFLCILFHRCSIFRPDKLHSVVMTASLQDVVRRKGKSVDPMSVALQFMHKGAVSLPYFDRSILTRSVQQAFAAPKHFRHGRRMAAQGQEKVAANRVPDLCRCILRAGGHQTRALLC